MVSATGSSAMPSSGDQLAVERAGSTAGNCSHCELSLARHAQLAHQEDIQRRMQSLGHFKGDSHSSSREPEYQYVVAGCVLAKFLSQLLACLHSIRTVTPITSLLTIQIGRSCRKPCTDHFSEIRMAAASMERRDLVFVSQ